MKVVLDSPLDMHLHLRDGDMLKNVVKYSAECFAGAIIMPNLTPPLTTIKEIKAYKKRILDFAGGLEFEPYMTLFFKDSYDYDFLKEAKSFVKAVKLYPSGITTNSEGGVKNFDMDKLRGVFEAMSELGLVLSVHGETDGFVLDREKEFVDIYENIATSFKDLKIVMEHITDRRSAVLLEKYDNIYATVTLHHLLYTVNDLLGGSLKPHLFCKPIVKTPEDKDVLRELALEAHPKVMFGSDSAPHPKEKKECNGVAAGIFSAPVVLPALCELFEKYGKLDNLQKFVSDNAKKIYDIQPPKKEVVLEKDEFLVPNICGNVVPLCAGEKLLWRCSVGSG
ncbi:MAG: dihydroorotase [Epsilonproteobacteria bacterium]|nr:dihydroorotase [Campylobacterota bacterium]